MNIPGYRVIDPEDDSEDDSDCSDSDPSTSSSDDENTSGGGSSRLHSYRTRRQHDLACMFLAHSVQLLRCHRLTIYSTRCIRRYRRLQRATRVHVERIAPSVLRVSSHPENATKQAGWKRIARVSGRLQ